MRVSLRSGLIALGVVITLAAAAACVGMLQTYGPDGVDAHVQCGGVPGMEEECRCITEGGKASGTGNPIPAYSCIKGNQTMCDLPGPVPMGAGCYCSNGFQTITGIAC